jgi:hypothetical protein
VDDGVLIFDERRTPIQLSFAGAGVLTWGEVAVQQWREHEAPCVVPPGQVSK